MATRQEMIENPMGYKPIPKLLMSLAIPAVVANITNALYNIVDQIFIGQGVGYLGNAATNIAFPLTTICMAIGLMTGLGSAANFNLELGRRNPDKAKRVAGTAAAMLLISGIVLCTLVLLFLKPLMVLFGATDQTLSYSMEYTGITAVGIPFFLFSLGTNPVVRADGSPKYSMIAIIAGAVLNTVLDPLFIFVFKMGIAGAAWATVISQVISAVILARYYFKFKTVKFQAKDFKPRFSAIKIIILLGITSFVFQFSAMIIQVTTNNLLKAYGSLSIYGSDIPIAVSGIVMKINVIFIAVIIGLVQGAQPICGFNYGAEQYNRVRETMRLLLKVTFALSVIAFLAFELFPRQIISIFGSGHGLYFQFAIKYMRIFLFFVFINGIQIAAITFFPSIGKAIKGAILSLSKQVILLLPLLVILPKFMGIDGIMFATPISDFLAFVLAVEFLRREFKRMPQ